MFSHKKKLIFIKTHFHQKKYVSPNIMFSPRNIFLHKHGFTKKMFSPKRHVSTAKLVFTNKKISPQKKIFSLKILFNQQKQLQKKHVSPKNMFSLTKMFFTKKINFFTTELNITQDSKMVQYGLELSKMGQKYSN